MARAFAEIAFTPTVRQQQTERGSAKIYDNFLSPDADRADAIGPVEQAFIEARDGFFQATVSETGWPYVQFRGGPAGFLRVRRRSAIRPTLARTAHICDRRCSV